MRTGTRLIQDALTLAALVCSIVPVLCSAQVDVQDGASPAAAVAVDATSPDAGAPGAGSAQREESTKSAAAGCLEPPPILRWQDYQGPFQKLVGTFAGKLELKSAHAPHYKPGTVLCSLEVKDKFTLFVRDTFEPISFLGAAFDAGLDQATNRDPTFGQGSEGYGKRFGADFASQTTWRFFTDFAYPTIFAEDPRYYRLIHGSGRQRLFHAVEHTFVAHRDSGRQMFNFSRWLGTASAVALSDVYHPGNERGLAAGARAGSYALAGAMGFDVLREFWPDIARKLHMPFRDTREEPEKETGRSPQ